MSLKHPTLRPVDFDPFAPAPVRSVDLPLTEPQSEMWTAASVSPEANCSYNQCFAFAFRGPLRIESLRTAIGQVVARHDGLRVAIAPDGSSQKIRPPFPVPIPLLDLQALDPEARRAEIDRLLQRECDTPFDLAKGPLLRAFVLRESETLCHFVLTAHHIVCDGWSSSVLFADLGRFYVADVTGIPAQLRPAPSYESYVAAQTSPEHVTAASADEEFWAAQYPTGVPVLDLPLERARPATKTFRSGQESLPIRNELYAAIKKTGARSGATLFATVLAAFEVLVHRLSSQSDFVVGIPFAGQLALEDPALIAHCVNTVPLRAHIDPATTFAAHLRAVRQSLGDAQDHARLTFGSLVRRLRVPRDPSRTPLVEITFNIDKVGTPFDFGALTIAGLTTPKAYSNFELGWNVVDTGSAMLVECGYNPDLFDASTVRRWLSHYAVVLEEIAERPDTTLDSIPLMTTAEQQAVLHRWNPEVVIARGALLHQRFEAQAARTPNAGAVTFGTETLSYRDVNRRANRLAHHLRDRGVKRGDLVGLRVERGDNTVVGILGILKAGAAYLPMDPVYPKDRIAFMLEDSKARVVVVDAPLAADVALMAVDAVVVDSLPPGPDTNLDVGGEADDLAYVLYTSGSTGMPKGCPISHYNVARLFEATEAWFGFDDRDVWTMFHSYSFDFSVWEIWGALLYGGRVVVTPYWVSRSPDAFLELVIAEGVTVLNQTPSAFRQLVQADAARPASAHSLRYVVFGGEALELQALRPWFDRYGDQQPMLVNMYGITETTVHVTYRPVSRTDLDLGLGSVIGVPISDLRVYLLDHRGAPVPIGVPGEIFVGGGGVAASYLNRPELSAERFTPDRFADRSGARLYRSGDLARRLGNGDLEYLGRIDDQVKIRGFRIELGEIEAALRECPGVDDAVILAETSGGERRLVAYVAQGSDGSSQVAELRKRLEARLPTYMIPSAWAFLEALPLTPNGKVDRKALARIAGGVEAQRREHVAPRTATEKVLVEIWSEVLQLEGVGVDENFFELGGHSMLATQVVSRARRAFGVELSLRNLFDAPTVAGLAQGVAEAKGLSGDAPRIEPRPPGGPCPLASTQEHLWLLERLAPGSPAYNIVDVIRMGGRYDPAALRRTLHEIVRRHEVLRTAFRHKDGQPVQVILPDLDLTLTEVDLLAVGEPEREREWARLAGEEGHRPFDLSEPPLLRVKVVHLTGEDHRLLVTIHHIVADEWSMELIKQEVKRLYAAFSEGRPSPLPELPIQYADFACWQRDAGGEGVRQRQLSYWKEALAGAPTLLALPADKPRPAQQTFRGATEDFDLPAGLLERLKALARDEQATLFMVLEAGFAAALHRYTGQDDILVGTPVSLRTRNEMEGLIGYFLNILVLRAQFTDDLSFRGLLRQTRERALGAYAHRDLPFQQLVAEMAPERTPGRSPLFQVMFATQDPDGVSSVGGAPGPRELTTATSKFELTLFLAETGSGLHGVMEYNTDLFEAPTVRRLCGHFATLLQAIAGDPDRPLSTLPVLTATEREQLRTTLAKWNDTSVTFPDERRLHRLFEAQARRTPDAPAVVDGQGPVSYAELDTRANRLAHHLRRFEVGPEVPVGVCLERNVDLIVGLLAVLKAGGAYVPLDPAYPKDRIAFMLKDSRARAIVTTTHLARVLGESAVERVLVDAQAEIIGAESSAELQGGAADSNLAYVIYTSGSTGVPKGVAIEHRSAGTLVHWARTVFTDREISGVLASTSVCFDLSVFEIFFPLAFGGRVILVPSALEVASLAGGDEVTLLNTVPSAAAELVRAGGLPRSIETVCLAGEPLPTRLVDQLYATGHVRRVYDLYGPSEDTTYSTFALRKAAEPPTIGRPIANTQAYVLDSRREPVPIGVVGELYLAGDGLARGYLHREALTAERFVTGSFDGLAPTRAYRTGDLVRYRSDGSLEFLGRADHQIKVRGFRIELGEIEAAVAAQPGVRDVCVILREDRPGDPRIVAYVVVDGDLGTAGGRLRAALRERLPSYMVPSHFVALAALPLTPNGKLDRKALPRPDPEAGETAPGRVSPRTTTEARVAAIFAEVLAMGAPGVHDNFFDLGGHSLKAVQIVTAIRSTLGVDLALRHLFEKPTVAGLAEIVDLLRVAAKAPAGAMVREEIEI